MIGVNLALEHRSTCCYSSCRVWCKSKPSVVAALVSGVQVPTERPWFQGPGHELACYGYDFGVWDMGRHSVVTEMGALECCHLHISHASGWDVSRVMHRIRRCYGSRIRAAALLLLLKGGMCEAALPSLGFLIQNGCYLSGSRFHCSHEGRLLETMVVPTT